MSDPAALLATSQFVLDAPGVTGRHREPLYPGVESTLLWRNERATAGVLWMSAGSVVPEHRHAAAEHHVWLAEGQVDVADRTLTQGAYWHVPPSVEHAVHCSPACDSVVFYLYLRTRP
ncbi:cupin domain-containing protein [Egicoccus sp. AB-alg2]|uniref:cupin domain-containing protein n=1 Tax=Egicoccus sp. AB-alg2 TaxID=3242693 RepID=UPI00359E03C8